MINIKSNLNNLDLKNKRVFLRADLNIPLHEGKILDDFRLEKILPTIDLILQKKGKIILATHISRPTQAGENLSTKILLKWFENKGYKIDFESDLDKAIQKSFEIFDYILLLENLRFFPEEKNKDKKFAEKLKKVADFYINDAFATLHRDDTSISLLPELFEKDKRTIGLLIESEIKNLNKIIDQKLMLILGGGKPEEKIKTIELLTNKLNSVALCPAVVFTFLKSENKSVGKSLVIDNLIDYCKNLKSKLNEKNIDLLFPKDYYVSENNFEPPYKLIESDTFQDNESGISIGSKSVDLFAISMKKTKLIFVNGLPGFLDKKESLKGAKLILDKMINSDAFTVIGGGDSVAIVRILGYETKIDYISTGGGATLIYLSGNELPGLKPFIH